MPELLANLSWQQWLQHAPEMLRFEWSWAFYLLPLPLLVRYLTPRRRARHEAALRVPELADFAAIGGSSVAGRARSRRWPLLLATLAWVLLVIAAARPQWHGEPIELPTEGRDLMLAVDLSGSMQAEDFVINGRQVNRLLATQLIAGEFVERRLGDRVGLILFGRQAYLQTPLTFDRETVKILLHEAAIGLAGKETAIGDAIGLMVKRLGEVSDTEQVMILLTDGANTAGEVEPLKAAELAASRGLKIYTIGIGADEMYVRTLFGGRQKVDPSADLDEDTLRAIAEQTGGQYFRARDTEELAKIYQLIDELEPVEQEAQVFRPMRALYPWPLSAALALVALLLLSEGLGARLNLKNGGARG